MNRPVDVIVIDTMSAVTPGSNENSGEDVGAFLKHLKELHRETGAVCVLLHHSGKDATKGARGWSGLRAAADAEIEVTRNGDYRSATVTKMKDGGDGENWPFKLQIVRLGFDPDGEEESSCVIEHTEERAPDAGNKQKPQGANQIVLYKTLQTLAAGGNAVEWVVLRDAAAKELGTADDGKETLRTDNLLRARDGLVARGLVFMHEGNRVGLTAVVAGGEAEWLEN